MSKDTWRKGYREPLLSYEGPIVVEPEKNIEENRKSF